MKKGIVLTATVVALGIGALWAMALGVAGEKAYWHIKDGECKNQPVIVPLILDKHCEPNIVARRCSRASDSVDVNCSERFKEK